MNTIRQDNCIPGDANGGLCGLAIAVAIVATGAKATSHCLAADGGLNVIF